VIRRPLVVVALLGCMAVLPTSAAGAQAPAPSSAAVRDELIVRFSARADGSQRARLRDSVDADAVRGLPLPGGQLVRLQGDVGANAAIARLERSRDVLYAEPNAVRTSSATTNDPGLGLLWGLRNTGQTVNGFAGTAGDDIDALAAWDLTTGSPTAPVAVIDSGVATSHPDLTSQITTNSGEIAGNGIDDDSNGYVDDVAGWDFVSHDATPDDANGHGTHVAGTIAARGNDATGVVGVAPTTRIMPLRVLDANGSGSLSDVVSAYGYAAREGARVVNLSLGGNSPSQAERDAIAAAPGVLFVAAAGNGGSDGVGDNGDVAGANYPCSYDLANVVCVAASDSNDQLAPFSNYGRTSVDLAAPGVNVLSDRPPVSGTPKYAYLNGTSMATPHVSGAAALAMALTPSASVAAVKQALLDGTDVRPALVNTVSGGRLDVRHTLELVSGAPPIAPPAASAPRQPPATTTPSAPSQPPATTTSVQPVTRDSAPPLASLLLGARQYISLVRRRGLRPRVTCPEACTANAVLSLTPRNAKRTRMGSGTRTVRIGRGGKHLPSPTSTTLTVRLTSSAARALRRLTRPIRASLAVDFVDATGNRRTLRRAVSLVPDTARRR